jgi:hypothetical protein
MAADLAVRIAAAIWSSTGPSITLVDDFNVAIRSPSPAAIVQVVADAASIASVANPHAKLVALGLNVAVIMLRHPSRNPTRDAQTSLGRGGRRV